MCEMCVLRLTAGVNIGDDARHDLKSESCSEQLTRRKGNTSCVRAYG